jgi:hypothetical protein
VPRGTSGLEFDLLNDSLPQGPPPLDIPAFWVRRFPTMICELDRAVRDISRALTMLRPIRSRETPNFTGNPKNGQARPASPLAFLGCGLFIPVAIRHFDVLHQRCYDTFDFANVLIDCATVDSELLGDHDRLFSLADDHSRDECVSWTD